MSSLFGNFPPDLLSEIEPVRLNTDSETTVENTPPDLGCRLLISQLADLRKEMQQLRQALPMVELQQLPNPSIFPDHDFLLGFAYTLGVIVMAKWIL